MTTWLDVAIWEPERLILAVESREPPIARGQGHAYVFVPIPNGIHVKAAWPEVQEYAIRQVLGTVRPE